MNEAEVLNAVVKATVEGLIPIEPWWPMCDDCRKQYEPPEYYTFDGSECIRSDENGEELHGDSCTENLCSSCAGPEMDPDDEEDPRRAQLRNDWRCTVCGEQVPSSRARPHLYHHGMESIGDWNTVIAPNFTDGDEAVWTQPQGRIA